MSQNPSLNLNISNSVGKEPLLMVCFEDRLPLSIFCVACLHIRMFMLLLTEGMLHVRFCGITTELGVISTH